jgi:spermidine synthase
MTAFFLSGSAALIYEVCWIRKASLVFGSTTFAVSTVFAVFFLGLALGSFLFGRLARRLTRPLRWFSALEIGLGLFALASPMVFRFADTIYGMIYRAAPDAHWLLGIARAGLLGLVLLPVTTAMGGTLPLLCQRYAAGVPMASRRIGFLYGLNTLGAAAGAAVAGFLLLPWIGLTQTLHTAVALSVMIGLVVAVLPSSRREPAFNAMALGSVAQRYGNTPRMPLLLYFGVGFVALGLEVLWFRFLSLIIRNTVYTYSLVLTVVLIGIVLGAWLASSFVSRDAHAAPVFGALQLLTGVGVIGLMKLPPELWRAPGDDLRVCALLLLLPALLSGASFPLAIRMILKDSNAAAFSAGLAAAVNMIGGVLGSLLIGFVVLPHFGLQPAIWFLTLTSLLIGAVALLWPHESSPRRQTASVFAVVAAGAVWFGLAAFGGPRLPADYLTETGTLIDHREGYGAHLAVVRQHGVTRLEIDRWWQGEDRKNHQALSAHVPALLHSKPDAVLVVGAGTGQTSTRFLMHDVERLDCVDIEPTLFDFIRPHFDSAWMADPRVRLIVEDGRSFLRHASEQYDIISLEVGQVFRPGVAYFYTSEAYSFARRRLLPDGLLVQFVPLPFFTLDQFRSVLGTFLEVFPQSALWYNTSELLLIGANSRHFPWRSDLAPVPPWNDEVFNDLDFVYWGGPAHAMNRPEVFLGGFLLGPESLARLAGPTARLRDDLPMLDYATTAAHHLHTNEIATAVALQRHLSPLASAFPFPLTPEFLKQAGAVQARNVGDIAASAMVRQAIGLEERGDRAGAMAALERALEWNDENADANLRLGDLLFRDGQPARAFDYFSTAARLRPINALAHHGMAVSLHRTRRVSEAIEHYRRAVELDESNAELHNNLGAALGEVGIFAEAIHHLETSLRLHPGHVNAGRNLAKLRQLVESSEAR